MKNNNSEIVEFINRLYRKGERILDILIEVKRLYKLSDIEVISYLDPKIIKIMKEQELKHGTIIKGVKS